MTINVLADDWIQVARSEEVGPGEITESEIEGIELVVWRSQNGKPCIMEARCPHQWSHLGSEGTVVGEEIVCLSHFWQFTQDGKGWKENLAGRRDRKGDIKVYECQESGGAVWARLPG